MKRDEIDDAIDAVVRQIMRTEPPAGLRARVMGQLSAPDRRPFMTLLDLHPLLTDSVGEREPVEFPLLDADLPEEPSGLLLAAERLGELVRRDEASVDEDLPHPPV